MIADPGQQTPVNDRPDVKQELIDAVDQWKKEVLSELDRSQRLFPVGHPSLKTTQLPARDAVATGKIKRSNRFPNCSYYLNWVDTNDTISWPIDVVEAGKYKVELYYCCAEKNLGTTIELNLGGNSVSKQIEIANDPPAIGAEEDRSIRSESLVKDFKPVEMGVIELAKGEGKLELRATKIPGDESIEFRLLLLTRVE